MVEHGHRHSVSQGEEGSVATRQMAPHSPPSHVASDPYIKCCIRCMRPNGQLTRIDNEDEREASDVDSAVACPFGYDHGRGCERGRSPTCQRIGFGVMFPPTCVCLMWRGFHCFENLLCQTEFCGQPHTCFTTASVALSASVCRGQLRVVDQSTRESLCLELENGSNA